MESNGGENQLERLERLKLHVARLEKRREQISRELAALQTGNRDLAARAAALESWRERGPIGGWQVATVAGQGPQGDPAALDAQGRVPVNVEWDGRQQELKARVALAWDHQHGGAVFHPRKGQAVYICFENGLPELPVIVGHCANPKDQHPYDPAEPGPRASLAATVDKDGQPHNPPSLNKYKTTIRSSTKGSGKASEIVMVDQPGAEELSCTSQGELRQHSRGGWYQRTEGDAIEQINGDASRTVLGNASKTVQGNYQRTVSGDFHSHLAGNKHQVITGDYLLEVKDQLSMAVQKGRSVHVLWKKGDGANAYLGGRNRMVIGEEVSVNVSFMMRAYFLVEDFFAQRAIYESTTTTQALMWGGNQVTHMNDCILAIENAATAMVNKGASVRSGELTIKNEGAAMQSFATKMTDGLEMNE